MSSRFQKIINHYMINRDKLIKNKRIYSEFIAKNKYKYKYNNIIIRKMSTNNSPPLSFNKCNGNGNGKDPKTPFWYMAAVGLSAYVSSKFTYKKM